MGVTRADDRPTFMTGAPLPASVRWGLPAGMVALALGLLGSRSPVLALGVAAAAAVIALAFAAPVANLVLIVFTTAVVPYTVQNHISGGGSRGVILSDLFLLAGLLRVVPGVLGGVRMERRQRLLLGPLVCFLGIVVYQFGRGVALGNDPSAAGAEMRILLNLSTFLVAIPILADDRARARLLNGLLFVGLVLGAWGMAQWLFDIGFAGEFGVREGINFTTSGRGQLQGGLFAFPVAAVLGFAVLVSGTARPGRQRFLVTVMTGLNLLCLLLTYERTFWVALMVAMGFVTLRAGRGPRARALIWGPAIVVAVLAAMATFAPKALGSARERFLSIGQYSTDGSLQYRILESRHVVDQIQSRPMLGAGLGAEILWSRPLEDVPIRRYHYSHNGYLWVAWKLGVPAALLLYGLTFAAVAWRAPTGDPGHRAVRHGSQAGLLLLLIASVTFPSYNTFGITATIGVLLALSATAPRTSSPGPTPGSSRTLAAVS